MSGVVAIGRMDDGHMRSSFIEGDVAEFDDKDVLSLPDILVPLEQSECLTGA
jgi:hypothetical protein